MPPAHLVRRLLAWRDLNADATKRPHRSDHECTENGEQVGLVDRDAVCLLVVLVVTSLSVGNAATDLRVQHPYAKGGSPAATRSGRHVTHRLHRALSVSGTLHSRNTTSAHIDDKQRSLQQALVRCVPCIRREVVRLVHDGGEFWRGKAAGEREVPKRRVNLRRVAPEDSLTFSKRRCALLRRRGQPDAPRRRVRNAQR